MAFQTSSSAVIAIRLAWRLIFRETLPAMAEGQEILSLLAMVAVASADMLPAGRAAAQAAA